MVKRLVARVYVEKAVYHIDRPFDYLVPPQLCDSLKRGCRVLVPFGRSNKKVQGMVAEILPFPEGEGQLKAIEMQLDQEPILSEELYSIAEFLVNNYFCTYYEAIKTILPIGKNVEVIRRYKVVPPVDEFDFSTLTQAQARIYEFLKTAKTERELSKFLECRQSPEKLKSVKGLFDLGLIEYKDSEEKRVKDKTVKMVKVTENAENIKLTPKQKRVYEIIKDIGAANPKELAYLAGVGAGVISAMVKSGALEYFERVLKLDFSQSVESEKKAEISLSPQQQEVFDGILPLSQLDEPKAALLWGVTGSGKTQVYIKLIEAVLDSGRTAMMLVPEISLTPQLLEKFIACFGGKTAVIHSALSPSERLNEFERIKSGAAQIVIGTRSAVFSPLENIGIIILDEEGEPSYKSESPPRYHAREVAKLRCVRHNALLLLGSATPSVDSYYWAEQGKYQLFTLNERYADANLPDVYIVDMMSELKSGNTSPISQILSDEINRNLAKDEQSIILLNRRGYSTVAACMDCGDVIKCDSCDIAMTYHRANGCLMCHYCGHTQRFVPQCPSCGGKHISLTGYGTQRVEDAIAERFSSARILRMDADTTYAKDSYEKAFADFKAKKYDILLGTQMIAKGLDFPDVTLVGVINAENGLYSADYKSSERVFSLITQVVGRSGRGDKQGRAYIQTLDVNNPTINFAANQDYKSFYEDEIYIRKETFMPPFCDFVVIGVSSPDEAAAENAAYKAIEILRKEAQGKSGIALKVIGAAKAPLYKMSNKYRYRVHMKCKLNKAMRGVISQTLIKCGESREFANVSYYADVNGGV